MKSITTRILLAVLLVAVAVLGGRFLWVSSDSEIGWETVANHWHDWTLGQLGWQRTPITEREPVEQAEFWLDEVDRVVSSRQQNAELAMGAAWVLDSPRRSFLITRDPLKRVFNLPFVGEWDREAIQRKDDEFEAMCSARCLELAAVATNIDPERVDWWRMRALLLFRDPMLGSEYTVRLSDWEATLDECAQHDRDNALYDYLAALQLWEESAEFYWEDAGLLVRIHDHEQFSRGVARFERAQGKTHLTMGKSPKPAVVEFVGHASLSRIESAHVAVSRSLDSRALRLVRSPARWAEARARFESDKGDWPTALYNLRLTTRMFDQFHAGKNSYQAEWFASICESASIAQIEELAEKNPGLLSSDELAALRSRLEAVYTDRAVLYKAAEQYAWWRNRSKGFDAAVPMLAVSSAVQMTVCLVVFVLVIGGLSRWLNRSEQRTGIGPFRHVVAWVIGFGVTFFLFGVVPSEWISRELQKWIVGGILSLASAVAMILLYRWIVKLCEEFRGGSARLPVMRLIGTITLWQFVVAVLLTVWHIAAKLSFHDLLLLLLRMPVVVWLALLLLPFVSLGAWILHVRKLRRRSSDLAKAHIAAAVLLSLATALVAAAFSLCPHYLDGVSWIPARGWAELSASTWKRAIPVEDGSWQWAVLQWLFHRGAYVTPGASLAAVACWFTFRWLRYRAKDGSKSWLSQTRTFLVGLLACATRSASALAACSLLVYLVVAPGVVIEAETAYQANMAYARAPEEYEMKLHETMVRIRSDPEAMEEIRANVAEEMDRYQQYLDQ